MISGYGNNQWFNNFIPNIGTVRCKHPDRLRPEKQGFNLITYGKNKVNKV